MTEAITKHDDSEVHVNSLATARSSGEVIQLPDGRAGVRAGLNSRAIGDAAAFCAEGVFKLAKSTSVVFLPGQKVYWDSANNQATHQISGTFYAGVCVNTDTVAAATTTVDVDLNATPAPGVISLAGGVDFATTLTAGTPVTTTNGGMLRLAGDTTAEAQRAEALSVESVAVSGDWIAEFEVDIADNGDDGALDINVGLANAGHASDADAITESIFVHVDGNSLNILAESDDGTTEVAATDTTVDYVEDTYFLVQIDGRDESDCQIYINGVLVLSGSTFDISAATGPLKFLAHLEKSSNDTPGEVNVRNVRVYTSPTP